MRKRKSSSFFFLLCILLSQSFLANAIEKIKLYSIIDSFYTIYETKLAIIYLNNRDIINFLTEQSQLTDLCEKKKENYSKLLEFYSTDERRINYIIIPTRDASKERELPSTRKTGFAPLDFFTSLVWLDLSSPYIPPYGYKPTYIDSSNYFKMDTLYKSIVNELLVKGKGQVFNKTNQSFEKVIYLETLDFHYGHGGRNFLFPDKGMFYNLDWYGDVGGRFDPECQ
jgi:hypothetical protein